MEMKRLIGFLVALAVISSSPAQPGYAFYDFQPSEPILGVVGDVDAELDETFEELLDGLDLPLAEENRLRNRLLIQLGAMGLSPKEKDSVNVYREPAPEALATYQDLKSTATPGIGTYIIGGSGAGFSEAPWQVALVDPAYKSSYFQGQFCGGSLISMKWVLTAAHCVDDLTVKRVSVFTGTNVLPDGKSEISHFKKNLGASLNAVKKIVVHPDYNSDTLEFDFALLELRKPVPDRFNSIEPISIDSTSPNGFTGQITGWGKIQYSPERYSVTLQKASIDHISDADCATAWGSDFVADSMICGEAGVGVSGCQGDSGGPLAVNDGGTWKLVGVVSWGKPTCSDYANVYAEVSSAYEWISCEAGLANSGYPFTCGDTTLRIDTTPKVAPGSWGVGKIRYQWFADGVPIKRGKKPAYKIARSDYGKELTVLLTDSQGNTLSALLGNVDYGFTVKLYSSSKFLPRIRTSAIGFTKGRYYSRINAYGGATGATRGFVKLPKGTVSWKWGLYDTTANYYAAGSETIWLGSTYDYRGVNIDPSVTQFITETSSWEVIGDYIQAPSNGKGSYYIATSSNGRSYTVYLEYLFGGIWAYYR